MLSQILDNIKHATWFIRSGVAPKGAEGSQLKKLKDVNHMASKKFHVFFFLGISFLFSF